MFEESITIASLAPIAMGLILGITIIYFGVSKLIVTHQSKTWPTAKGIISISSLDSYIDQTDDVYKHRVYISYDYFIGHDTFYNSEERVLSETDAKILHNKYFEGMEVNVYYDPNNLKKTTLEPGKQGGCMLIFVGLFFVLLSASFIPFILE